VICLGVLQGCEPLRKKFIRKSKEDDSNRYGEVVLEPKDYSPQNYTPEENYTKHYNLWVIWGKSLEEALSESQNEKRHRYFLQQGLKELRKMRQYLKEEKKAGLQEMIQGFEALAEELAQPSIVWNKVRIRNQLNSYSIKIRTQYNPHDLEGYFVD
jgi:predicted RNase H-like nuclease (RuvC/YqgF family)